MCLEAAIWGLPSWYHQEHHANFLAQFLVTEKVLNDRYNVLLWPDLHTEKAVDKLIPVCPSSDILLFREQIFLSLPRTKRLLWQKASARLLEDLEASWEAAKDSEQLVPMKTLPVRCLLDLTAWHHLSFISWRNWKFLGWHIFIGSVWYLKMYKSYGSTLGFSKIYQQITKWNPSVQANGWD